MAYLNLGFGAVCCVLCSHFLSPLLCRDHQTVYLGDKNPLNVTIHAQNQGEGGAYEAELHVIIPPEAYYIGVLRNHGVGILANFTHIQICDHLIDNSLKFI